MNEIKCPKCGTVFQISETDYESIVKQIRDKEFEKEITLRNEQHQIDKDNAVKLAKADIEKQLNNELNKKIQMITTMHTNSCVIEL
jgi:predicted  nucleic acid-binding Zn-ribbon protein